ncbi:hypothetical protein [Phocoenobacter skyensis]|uniref:Uncharacterized protein n=1 Tax=Phocoenobacter skyensis TaxID=97481 RepID=A0A1H7WNL8_9PAST|nr:hypothetical protein [Pasteurella skyensis]MDP8078977.1 hypothetical protein [Pasteurella skyensis]MDP8084927.1 hypothetical protein [Pasteurella skyensis]MDP8185229.1 hypothetical protein [Pasteurella skyensis]QLB23492.1 hypothetical protein A6B44_09890 [Pasteurella skyensis]SEM23031.1 hypothetical protein SAMN05444853_10930 [Pasteurella skyensis]
MNNDQELIYRLKIKFGIAPNEPTPLQLEKIKQDIQEIVQKGVIPSESDWARIVKKHCPNSGRYAYYGADTSDLITLMQLATKK